MNTNGCVHIVIGLPNTGRYTWACWFNYEDEDSICYENKHPELFESDGTLNVKISSIVREWSFTKLELNLTKNNFTIIILENINLREIKKVLELAQKYFYSIEFHLPDFGYMFYPNELDEKEQLNKIKLTKCNYSIKNQIVYTENNFSSMLKHFNSVRNFIKSNYLYIEDPFDPTDWIKRIDLYLEVRRPTGPYPKNPSPRSKKFFYIQELC